MKEAEYYEVNERGVVTCTLCPHSCAITEDSTGICGVRKNIKGKLVSLIYGYPIALNSDPVEKKPLYHFLPGTQTFSLAAVGCNFRCSFCQNWQISQSNNAFKNISIMKKNVEPEKIVDSAIETGCRSISFTYTEPTVFYEYMKDISQIAQDKKIKCTMVSNGYISEKPLEDLLPSIDAFNIDLKSFDEAFYRRWCGGKLSPVLSTLRNIKNGNKWLEITTLIVSGENNSHDELKKIVEFIADLGTEIPWHISRCFPNYKMNSITPTKTTDLEFAEKCAKASGLEYVYVGNTQKSNETRCPSCNQQLIFRSGYHTEIQMEKMGKCIRCGKEIEGVWE